MRHLVSFKCMGVAVVPWSVPEIGQGITKTGRKYRRVGRRKKSNIAAGQVSLDQWQQLVRLSASDAMERIPVTIGPVKLVINFFARTPKGKKHGQLWEVPLKFNSETGEYTKSQPRGKPEADLINMFKGTEDAIQGVVMENDVQTRQIAATTLYGPLNGVEVHVYEIEPTDHPGEGDPV